MQPLFMLNIIIKKCLRLDCYCTFFESAIAI